MQFFFHPLMMGYPRQHRSRQPGHICNLTEALMDVKKYIERGLCEKMRWGLEA